MKRGQELTGLAEDVGIVLDGRAFHKVTGHESCDQELGQYVSVDQGRPLSSRGPRTQPLSVRAQLACDVPVCRVAGLHDEATRLAPNLQDGCPRRLPAVIRDDLGVRDPAAQQVTLLRSQPVHRVPHEMSLMSPRRAARC